MPVTLTLSPFSFCQHHHHFVVSVPHKLLQFWSPKKEVSPRQLRDREREREKERYRDNQGDYASYLQSRMNHSSQQSRAISYVRQWEKCPFVLKRKSLPRRAKHAKRYPSTWRVATLNGEQRVCTEMWLLFQDTKELILLVVTLEIK